MRTKLLGVVLAVLIAPLAYAGDLTRQGHIAASVMAHADEQWNRTGMYLGLAGAYDITELQADGFDNIANGKLMGGAFLGYNWRASQGLVLGVEADWIFTGIEAEQGAETVALKASTDHLVSVRARAGVPLGPALLYVTGGPAWQHAKLTVSEGEDAISDRTWQLGAAFGGGAEIELSRAMAVRLEALHYVFPTDGAPLNDLLDSDNQHTTVRAGVLVKLN